MTRVTYGGRKGRRARQRLEARRWTFYYREVLSAFVSRIVWTRLRELVDDEGVPS
jgi:hypothetical protein